MYTNILKLDYKHETNINKRLEQWPGSRTQHPGTDGQGLVPTQPPQIAVQRGTGGAPRGCGARFAAIRCSSRNPNNAYLAFVNKKMNNTLISKKIILVHRKHHPIWKETIEMKRGLGKGAHPDHVQAALAHGELHLR